MTDMKYDYPEGLTTCDHLAHDIKQGRFPERSSISQFICERGAPDDKSAPETTAKIAALANRFWSIHPSTIAAMNLSREEFYAREMTRLLTSETERLTALNNKLTEDFNTLALDRRRWQDRAEKGEIIAPPECACDDPECPKRHWSLTLRQAYENAVARLREAEAGLRSWEITAKRISEEEARQSKFDQCPKCGGDCSAANPPVYNCPMVGCNKDF